MAEADFHDWDTSAFVIPVSELLGRFIGEQICCSSLFCFRERKIC
mgnify:CR=1 FL=1